MKAKKRPDPEQPGQIKPPTATEVDVIVAEKGGFGKSLQAHPNPHKTHSPKPKVQGACV